MNFDLFNNFDQHQFCCLLLDVIYESIADENPYESAENVSTKTKITTANKRAEPNETDYCNPDTALRKINFSDYNLAADSLPQNYKLMRENSDKLFGEEFKVGCIMIFGEKFV